MVKQPMTTEEVIKLKQEIIRITPNSGASITNKAGRVQDVIFFIKSPGVDAYLFNDGTVTQRLGFGDRPHLLQWGNMKKSYEKLLSMGFRPYGIFYPPGLREKYEQDHKDAKEKISKARDFFPAAAEVKFTRKEDRLGYNQVSIPQPRFPVRQEGIDFRPTMQNNNDADYARLFANIADVNKLTRRTTINNPIMDINQYSNWNNKMYNNVLRRRNQLFKTIKPTGKTGADKTKTTNSAEIKAKILSAKLNAQLKKIKADEESEGIFI